MNEDHRTLRESLGAYVLGGLEPSERSEVERHLAGCAECRDDVAALAGLPSLLSRLRPEEAVDDVLVPSPDLSDRVAVALAAERRELRRGLVRWRAAAGVAAAVAATLLVLWAPWSGPDLDRAIATGQPAAGVTDVAGTAAAIAWEWGTTIELDVQGLPAEDAYVLWAVGADGRRQQAGTWGSTADHSARVRGACAIQRRELERVEVTTPTGDLLLSFEFRV